MGYTKSRIIINGVGYTISDDSAIKYDRQMDIAESFKTQARVNIGLGNVDNTSDANKPISTAQAAALALKAEKADTPLKSDIAIIVNGDSTSTPVPVGGYAYIKNNTHGLSDGLYYNKSTAAYTSGMTANGIIFAPVSGGGLNALQQATAFKKLWSGSVGQNTAITLSESITHFNAVLVVATSDVGTSETRIIPVDAINYISSQQTTPDDAWVVGVMYQSSAYAMTLIGFLSDTQIYVMDRNVISGWSYYRITAVYGMN